MARGKLAVWAAVLVWSVGLQAQPVYKWVDADGKTHYGSQPPPAKQDAEPLKLQSNNGSTKSASPSTKPAQQYNPDGTVGPRDAAAPEVNKDLP